jgi:hypothetical protein
MTTLKLSTPGDIPLVAAHVLGFIPSDSLVILGIGGGPHARVDLGPEAVASLSVALPHWSTVLAVVYSDDATDLEAYRVALDLAFPTLQVVNIVHVDPAGRVNGQHSAATVETPHKRIASSRDELTREAADEHDADTALVVALTAYEVGDGAKAWIYLDRARELGLADDTQARELDRKLRTAVDPRA